MPANSTNALNARTGSPEFPNQLIDTIIGRQSLHDQHQTALALQAEHADELFVAFDTPRRGDVFVLRVGDLAIQPVQGYLSISASIGRQLVGMDSYTQHFNATILSRMEPVTVATPEPWQIDETIAVQ